MSDREFENYLALLTNLLRLDPKQRVSIADELRAHLEDRLEELLARGVSHDDAVRQALAEFGDAAGLAGQFVAISRNRKRRWLMRLATFSVAATLLIAAGLVIFWPGRNAAPGVAVAVAQDSVAPEKPAGGNAASQEPRLQELLDKRIDLEVVEVPLKDVISYLQHETGIQFVIRQKIMEEASVSPDTPVTRSLKRVRVSTLLDLVLSELELTYVERDELLLITTPEDAESRMEVRVYDCRDLLTMPAPDNSKKTSPRDGSAGPKSTSSEIPGASAADPFGAPQGTLQQKAKTDGGFGGGMLAGGSTENAGRKTAERPLTEHEIKAQQLMDIVSHNVDPQTWDEYGGPGSIGEYNGLIVVAQTGETHRKVERLFDMLREAAGLDLPKSGKVVR